MHVVIRRREVTGEKEREDFPLRQSDKYYFWYSRMVLVTYDDERGCAKEGIEREREREQRARAQ